ncbi:MAG: AmmeMemoRadiSam system protein A [Myxococcales bacterium]|nr:AmmeMemoRadiSam system protein A [Myxococcales bacterium]
MSEKSEPITPDLSDPDRRELLRIARITLKHWLKIGYTPPGVPHRGPLVTPSSAFVTIHVDGHLRGCIGRLDPDQPLYRAIMDLTVAATRDARFEPVRTEEIPQARIEISVLSPRTRVTDPDAITLGLHGLVITRGPQRGLYLPKVAAEHGWDQGTFLAETCRKAGLDGDAWRDAGTEIEIFTAQVFTEEQYGLGARG